jgi:hypothetical protein
MQEGSANLKRQLYLFHLDQYAGESFVLRRESIIG